MNTLSRDELSCVAEFLTIFDIVQLAKSNIVIFDQEQANLRIKNNKWFKKSGLDTVSWYKFYNWCPPNHRDTCNELPMILARSRWAWKENPTINIERIISKIGKQYPDYDRFVEYITSIYGSMHLFNQYSKNIVHSEHRRGGQHIIRRRV